SEITLREMSCSLKLGRYQEIESHFALESSNVEKSTSVNYVASRAIFHGIHGRTTEAFADFELAIEKLKKVPNGYTMSSIWSAYASRATRLGRLDVARVCRERA